jgi:hypothetical protein
MLHDKAALSTLFHLLTNQREVLVQYVSETQELPKVLQNEIDDIKCSPELRKVFDIAFVRQSKPIGVFVAEKRDGYPVFGWSKRCKKDVFNRHIGLCIAHKRANGLVKVGCIPQNMVEDFKKFRERVVRYYKEDFVNLQ